jgi:type II secretory pathway component PulF
MIFYVLFIIYWFYFLVIQFNQHRGPALMQLGNTLMSTAWYFFFSTAAVVYYYICVKLSQRAESLRDWLKDLKCRKPTLDEFYLEYNAHYKKAKAIAIHWNLIISH